MSNSVDFGKIAFNAVKRNTSKGHAPDMIDAIMDDFVAGGNFQNSFNTVADTVGVLDAVAVFFEFVDDDEILAYSEVWKAS